MTEVPEENLAEEAEPTPEPDPEEYEADVPVSPDTGTLYEGSGEPDRTPLDDELEDGAP